MKLLRVKLDLDPRKNNETIHATKPNRKYPGFKRVGKLNEIEGVRNNCGLKKNTAGENTAPGRKCRTMANQIRRIIALTVTRHIKRSAKMANLTKFNMSFTPMSRTAND